MHLIIKLQTLILRSLLRVQDYTDLLCTSYKVYPFDFSMIRKYCMEIFSARLII